MDIGKGLQSAFEDGYYKGKSEAEENAAKEIAKLKAELDKCEEQYNKLWEYTQEKHKQISKLTAERDAAVADIERRCYNCKHLNTELNNCLCSECYLDASAYYSHAKWEWRGVQEKHE